MPERPTAFQVVTTSQSGYLTFAPGEMVKTVRVTLANDTAVEPAENFTLYLSGARAPTRRLARHGDRDDHRQRRDGRNAGGARWRCGG
jgi:hypothetical protein